MLTGLKILIFSMLLGGKTCFTTNPGMSSEVEFLGFFDENKYCYLRKSFLESHKVGYIETLEFVIKDFDGKELKREILWINANDKSLYFGKTDIIRFLRKKNVQKGINFKLRNYGFINLEINNNIIYSKISSAADTVTIADSNLVRKQIVKHNKEPILIDYVKYINEIEDAKLGDFEKMIICSGVKDVYEKNGYYLIIIYNHDGGDTPGKQDLIIILKKTFEIK